jgi:hypothetical protein
MLFKTSEMRLFFLDFIDFASCIFRFLENYSHTIIVKKFLKQPTNQPQPQNTDARNSQLSGSPSLFERISVVTAVGG